MQISYFQEGERRLMSVVKRINAELSNPNKTYALKFKDYLELNNRKPLTLAHRLKELRFVLKLMDKDAKKLTKTDIEEIVRKINNTKREDGRELAGVSKGKIKLTLKSFYKWLYNSDNYPDLVRWIKVERTSEAKLPDQLLTEDEVKQLLLACENQRDKAIIGLLWDTGMRVGELLGLKMKNVILSKNSVSYAIVDGKTGQRRIPLTFSIPYLANYLNEMRGNAEPDEVLFLVSKKPLDYHHIKRLLNQLEERTKLKKHLYPHLFRHSRATYYANFLTESQAKMFFGWTGDSRMMAKYVHHSGRDIDKAILQVYGMDKENGEKAKPTPQAQECSRCKAINEITAMFCVNCGSPLGIGSINRLDEYDQMKEKVQKLENAIEQLYQYLDEKPKKEIENTKL